MSGIEYDAVESSIDRTASAESADISRNASVSILLDAGNSHDKTVKFVTALNDLLKHQAVDISTARKIAALEFALAMQKLRFEEENA